MAKIRIATDSTADIPKALCEELDITVLPLTVLAEGREYRDGVDIQPEEFYGILDRAATLPVSSQVSSQLYTELFERTWREGYTDLIQVTLNAKGSGTYQAAVLTRDLFFEDHPEAAEQLHIHIIDSRTYSMAYGLAVIEGAKMIRQGAALEDVLAHIQDWVDHARPMFVPLDLKCVKRSGRVSAAAAFVGDALGLKPLITFEDGESRILSKVRGENKAIAALVETCLQERRSGSSYAIVYGGNREAYEKLREACAQVMDQPPLTEYPVGCIIAINTGPNMIGIIYRT
ncbi:MAG: DegV family protein [Oscillospiraceae bacterium]